MLVLFFVLRPLIKFILTAGGEGEAGVRRLTSVRVGGAQLETERAQLEKEGAVAELEVEGYKEIENLRNLAGQDAHEFAKLLKNWLR